MSENVEGLPIVVMDEREWTEEDQRILDILHDMLGEYGPWGDKDERDKV